MRRKKMLFNVISDARRQQFPVNIAMCDSIDWAKNGIFQFSNLMNLCDVFFVWFRGIRLVYKFLFSGYIKMIGVPFLICIAKFWKIRITHVPPQQQRQ